MCGVCIYLHVVMSRSSYPERLLVNKYPNVAKWFKAAEVGFVCMGLDRIRSTCSIISVQVRPNCLVQS